MPLQKFREVPVLLHVSEDAAVFQKHLIIGQVRRRVIAAHISGPDDRLSSETAGLNGIVHAADRIAEVDDECRRVTDYKDIVSVQLRDHVKSALGDQMCRVLKRNASLDQRFHSGMVLKSLQHVGNGNVHSSDIAAGRNDTD